MLRPLLLFLLLFIATISLSHAQEGKPAIDSAPPASSSDPLAITLLREAHDVGLQLPPRARASLLVHQAQTAAQLSPGLGKQWADELLQLSFQVDGIDRSAAQDTATAILARLDPDKALELLQSTATEEPDPKRTSSIPHMQLVVQVFELIAARDGVRALPELQQEAEQLGIHWHYPYGALAQAAMQTVSKDWGKNNQHAVEVVQSVFETEFANYSQDPRRGYFDDMEFGNMLRVVAGGLPAETVRPALRTWVNNLLATDLKKYHFRCEVYTKDGNVARADNAIDAAILNFGSVVHQVDPELAQQLEATRPELRTALPYAQGGLGRSWTFGPSSPISRPVDPNAEQQMDAIRLSHINADVAIAKAEDLPSGPQRTQTILELARTIAGDDPRRAAELITQAYSGNNTAGEETTVDSISARAYVAAAQQNKEDLHTLLESGFDLARRTLSERPKVNFVLGLGQMVQLGIQNEPDATVSFLHSLPESWLKANLLWAAASALNPHMRLAVSSHPKPAPEAPAKKD